MNTLNVSRAAVYLMVACVVDLNGAHAEPPEATMRPTRQVLDLKIGESAEVSLDKGKTTTVKLIDVQEKSDSMSGAGREARAVVQVNGETAFLTSANYNLPKTVGGVQIDCPITRGYNANSGEDSWGLEKDARLRVWPVEKPWIEP